MKFIPQRLLYNLGTMFLPYFVVAILSVFVTEDRHPHFWYLHGILSVSLLLLSVLTAFKRVKE